MALLHRRDHADRNPISSEETKLWNKNFTILFFLSFLTIVYYGIHISIIPFYVNYLGGNEFLSGLVVTGFFLTSFIIRPICGWLLDHHSRRNLLLISLIAAAVFTIVYVFVPVLGVLIVFRVLQGFFWSGMSSASNTNACDFIPKHQFAQGLSLFSVPNTVGMAVAPAVGLWLMNSFGYIVTFSSAALSLILCFVMALNIDFRPVAGPDRQGKKYFHGFSVKNLFSKTAIPASVVQTISQFPYAAVCSFTALYAATRGIGNAGFYFAIMAGASTLVRLFSGSLADKRGEAPGVHLGNVCYAVSLILLALYQNSGMFYLSAVFYGIGLGLGVPALQTMAVRISPANDRGAASATYFSSYDVSNAIGGFIAGSLITLCGYSWMFGLMAIWLVVSSLVYQLWASKTVSAFRNLPQQMKY